MHKKIHSPYKSRFLRDGKRISKIKGIRAEDNY
jgi:hypothetical protein